MNACQAISGQDPSVDHLLCDIGRGEISIKSAVETARATCHSHTFLSAALVGLAKCGSWGKRPFNAERDLHRFTESYLQRTLELYHVPIRADYGKREELAMWPCLPVHELFAELWLAGHRVFEQSCYCDDGFPCLQCFCRVWRVRDGRLSHNRAVC